MRIALTGADGFTGRYVTEELSRRGLSWVALEGDITNAGEIDAVVASTPFDRLIHLAAIAFAGGGDWQAFYQVNQLGTFHLLQSVARHQPGAVCLLASSAAIYGQSASGMVDESALPNPSNHYAVSKYAMELGAAFWRSDLDIRVARPFNYTGAGQETQYLVPKIVDHYARRASVIELGNIHVRRDFGDVRSVARAYCDLIVADQPNLLVNLATGRLSSISDIMAKLTELTGHSMEVRVNPAFVRANDVDILGGSTEHLRSLAPAWQPEALEDTLAWMLASAQDS